MLSHLAEVSIRSLLLAIPAMLALWLRRRRTAAFEHAIWSAVVCGMLALLAFGQSLPRLPLRVLDARSVVLPTAPQTAAADSPLADEPEAPSLPPSGKSRLRIDWIAIAAYAYGAVALAFLAQLATGIWMVRRLIATTRATGLTGVYESERIAIPLTVGWLRPKIILPKEWRKWDGAKLDAVLAHEGAHARRRDGLVAALAGVNRSLFWFHPLAWILDRRLALLAEQACDETCVAELGDRHRYARLLLEMALVVDGSHGRMRRHALTMAAGSHIRQRIESLLVDGRTFSRGLTAAGCAGLMLCAVPLVWAAGAVEVDRQPALPPLATPRWMPPAPPVLVAQAQAATAQTAPAAAAPKPPAPAQRPHFDVASVKPCGPNDGAGRSGRGGGGGRGFGDSPGRFWVNCLSADEMIDIAYGQFAADRLVNDGGGPMAAGRIRGGPAWAKSDYYSVDAETDDPVANGQTGSPRPASMLMRGPMLRALLEERFHLKIHREIEELPMYALVVAKGGLKMKPMEEGACTPHEPGTPLRVGEMFPEGQKPLCVSRLYFKGPNWAIDAAGQTLSNLAGALSGTMDRHVLDQTGITDKFIYHLTFAHDDQTPGHFPEGMRSPFGPSDEPPGPSVFTALEQLGLKLEPTKGPHGYLVIDSVERPTVN